MFLKVETDYIIQLGRICGGRSFLIQDFLITVHSNDIRKAFRHDQGPSFKLSPRGSAVFLFFCQLHIVVRLFFKLLLEMMGLRCLIHKRCLFLISLTLMGVLPTGSKENTIHRRCVHTVQQHPIHFSSQAINTAFMKLIMCSCCWQRVKRGVDSTLYVIVCLYCVYFFVRPHKR